jgi:lysozyme
VTDIARLRQATRDDEGDKPIPYRDSKGLWTFGTGRCLETHPLTAAEWKFLLDNKLIGVTLTQEGDDYLLDTDLAASIKQCASHFEFWSTLNDARQNALAEMAYQMGIDKLCGFHDTIAAMREGRWNEVEALALDSDWARHDSPKRAKKVAHQLGAGTWPP